MSDKKFILPVPFMLGVLTVITVGVPTVLAALPIYFATSFVFKMVAVALAPLIASFSYLVLCCALSTPFHKSIFKGKFPRDTTHIVYGPRRLYGYLWGSLFYLTPLYHACLSIVFLKKILLRGFGYKGDLEVVIAPDAWIRDLPLLKFSKGVYVANKATIGTNICLANGNVLVDSVTLGEKSLIGHLALTAPGSVMGAKSEIGVTSALGIRAKVGENARLGVCGLYNHGCRIGDNVEIGGFSHIGIKAYIANSIRIPAGANIPNGANIRTQEEVAQHISSETQVLKDSLEKAASIFVSRNQRMNPTDTGLFDGVKTGD